MRLAVRRELFDHADWRYELLNTTASVRSPSSTPALSRGFASTSPSPGLASLATIPREAILDGEIVCLDRDGSPQFDQLFYRRGEPYLDRQDLRNLPLIERKRILRGIVPRQDSRLLYVRHVEGCGVDLLREVCARDLEGIVAKWKDGAYLSGDVTSWVKIKNPSYSQGIGRWERFQRKPQSRVYAARAISGLAP